MGFQHWLSQQQLLEAANDEFIAEIYPALRMGDLEAKRLVARRYMRMAFALCSGYAPTYWDTDELVAEALFTLVEGVQKISTGALDDHKPKPNVGGYLNISICGALNKLVTRRLGVNEKTYRKHGGNVPRLVFSDCEAWVRDSRSAYQNATYKETISLVNTSLDGRESEVLRLRLMDFNDAEIGQKLGLCQQRIFQIRSNLKDKLVRIIGDI